MLKKTIISTLMSSTLIAGAMFTVNANASFASCTGEGYDISDNVAPNIGCTILEPLNANQNDSVSPPQSSFTVNEEAFFGFTDWSFDGKYDNIGNVSGTDGSSLFDFSGNNQSGTFAWTDGVIADFSDIMLVFKDGGDTNLVGYLIDMPLLLTSVGDGGFGGTGTYTSPFEEPPFAFPGQGPRDISHISVYYRSNGGPGPGNGDVPEPGILLLLGAGLIGLSLSRRRQV